MPDAAFAACPRDGGVHGSVRLLDALFGGVQRCSCTPRDASDEAVDAIVGDRIPYMEGRSLDACVETPRVFARGTPAEQTESGLTSENTKTPAAQPGAFMRQLSLRSGSTDGLDVNVRPAKRISARYETGAEGKLHRLSAKTAAEDKRFQEEADDRLRRIQEEAQGLAAQRLQFLEELTEEWQTALEKLHVSTPDGRGRIAPAIAMHSLGMMSARRRQTLKSPFPLHEAARECDTELVRLFISAGAPSLAPDRSGRTAVDLARSSDREGSHAKVLSSLDCGVFDSVRVLRPEDVDACPVLAHDSSIARA